MGQIFYYPVLIKEVYLDSFGHMNNAVYLTLFEEARWDLVTKNGFGIAEIQKSGIGYTVLQANLKFLKELKVREEIVIQTQGVGYERKLIHIAQKMVRGEEDCCLAEITIALFDIHQRKLIPPTPKDLAILGFE